jgi:hypothetical protein
MSVNVRNPVAFGREILGASSSPNGVTTVLFYREGQHVMSAIFKFNPSTTKFRFY